MVGRGDPHIVLLDGFAGSTQEDIDIGVIFKDIVGDRHYPQILEKILQNGHLRKAPITSLGEGVELSNGDDGDQGLLYPCP
jgi:hypothetical protein